MAKLPENLEIRKQQEIRKLQVLDSLNRFDLSNRKAFAEYLFDLSKKFLDLGLSIYQEEDFNKILVYTDLCPFNIWLANHCKFKEDIGDD